MDFIKKENIVALDSDFQVSHQLLWNENSNSERITITKVHVYPGKQTRYINMRNLDGNQGKGNSFIR